MWIIEKVGGVVYDGTTHMLKIKGGENIAAVCIDKKGDLEVSLMMDTNFISDKGWGKVGFNGCENHMVSSFRLEEGGGTLEHQEDRHSIFSEPGEKISIKIMIIEGDMVLPSQEEITVRSFFAALRTQIRGLFGSPLGQKKEAV